VRLQVGQKINSQKEQGQEQSQEKIAPDVM